MKRMIALTVLIATVSGTSLAQGILGTNKSFSTTVFCKTYKCSLMHSEGRLWTYKTNLGEYINVERQSSDPASKITGTVLAIPYTDSNVYPGDSKTFKALQMEMLGSVKASMSMDCYLESKALILKQFTYRGSNFTIGCRNEPDNMDMLVMIVNF